MIINSNRRFSFVLKLFENRLRNSAGFGGLLSLRTGRTWCVGVYVLDVQPAAHIKKVTNDVKTKQLRIGFVLPLLLAV